MLTNWLVTLRLTPETSNTIPTVKGKTIRVSLLSKREMVVSGLAESETEQAEEFNGQFTDVFSKTSESEVPQFETSAPPMSDIHISNEGVIKMMKGLNPSKALGPDELHPRVLKELAVELGPVFAHLFHNVLIRVKFPRNGLWLTSVHLIRRATELYQVTVVQCL